MFGEPSPLRKPFPGFTETFHKKLVFPETSSIAFSMEKGEELAHALEGDAVQRVSARSRHVSDAHARLASRDLNRPDVVLMCIPDEVLAKVSLSNVKQPRRNGYVRKSCSASGRAGRPTCSTCSRMWRRRPKTS